MAMDGKSLVEKSSGNEFLKGQFTQKWRLEIPLFIFRTQIKWYSHKRELKTDVEEKKLLNKAIILFSSAHKMYSRSFKAESLMSHGLF